MCAVKRGHHKAAVFLIKRGSPIDLRDAHQRTCLHVAAYSANAETVDIILEVCHGCKCACIDLLISVVRRIYLPMEKEFRFLVFHRIK